MSAAENYYYLVASLPLLRLGDPIPFTVGAFLELCQGQIDDRHLAHLATVSLVPGEVACGAADRRWQQWETWLRNQLVRFRAGKSDRQPEAWLRDEEDVFPGSRRQVEEALANGEPLARERALDRLRWAFLDDCEVGHTFDFDTLVVYFLKLQLASRWSKLDAEAGGARLDKLIEMAVDQARAKRQVHEE